MDRLKRETSPTPGFKPAILPQHEKADGTSLTTGENNPLPVGNYVQNDNGIWVPVSKQNPMPTQLTGSNVGYSNDTKPTGKKGETFLELDTLNVYVNDGEKWVRIV